MHDELIMCPFERSIAGPRGTVLLRRHHEHASRCAEAIRKRQHPAWSSMRVSYHVTDAA